MRHRTAAGRPISYGEIPVNEADRAYLRQGALGAPNVRAVPVRTWLALASVATVLVWVLAA